MSSSAISKDIEVVFFDLEGTGLMQEDQIVQIAAKSGSKSFSVYILPTCQFKPDASAMTGLTLFGNKLYLKSVAVPTKSRIDAITEFITFLRGVGLKVMLAAHGGSKYDFPKILRLVKQLNMMNEFSSVVCGFIDTFTLLRSKLRTRFLLYRSFSQVNLAKDYLGLYCTSNAHNALVDVEVLERIINCSRIDLTREEILKSAVSIQEFQRSYRGEYTI
ncbi:hypothetical protein PV325_005715 [Microctonus aethiopoides]|uniref:Exonuclease domain-containing protein n=1 Tax=Microctonus aethiopoides TaxID=144406 RepID=A0AA39FAZ2_9HYME|nr:hypothetical protein PV325_005715 [Microctonus aethiopoides]KAK0097234.1 hypothetical protein PV326_002817 [Microctonus aethiopoides]KAK0166222.1 hypothetical protein PV328_004663 [Microctonus aethiopoides]